MYILSHTLSQLSRNSGQIVTFDKGVPPINTLVLANICEYPLYRRKLYC